MKMHSFYYYRNYPCFKFNFIYLDVLGVDFSCAPPPRKIHEISSPNLTQKLKDFLELENIQFSTEDKIRVFHGHGHGLGIFGFYSVIINIFFQLIYFLFYHSSLPVRFFKSGMKIQRKKIRIGLNLINNILTYDYDFDWIISF